MAGRSIINGKELEENSLSLTEAPVSYPCSQDTYLTPAIQFKSNGPFVSMSTELLFP
jgi:hypothetical protein